MSRLLVVTPSDETGVPAALSMLPHQVQVSAGVPEHIESVDVDVIVVDARTQLADARDLTRRVRGGSGLPTLLLVSSGALAVLSRDWGADDFVLDTAEPSEVDARLRMLISSSQQANLITCGPVVIDEAAYTVTVAGLGLDLTYTEFELLKFLVTHPGRVLTREHLLSEVWGYDYYGGMRTVDVHIRRLRAKLGPEHEGHIGTVRNVGYRFQAAR